MKSKSNLLLLLMTFGLSACGGSSDSSDGPTLGGGSTDVCQNYPGEQDLTDITAKGFIEDGQGNCQLKRNHEALALSGVDKVLMEGWTGAGSSIAVIDSGYRVTHEAIIQQIQAKAVYHDDNTNYLLETGEKENDVAGELVAAHGTSVASMVVACAPGAGLWLKATADESLPTSALSIATQDALDNEGIGIINHSNDLFWYGLIFRTASTDDRGILPSLTTGSAVAVTSAGNSGMDLSSFLDSAQYISPTLQSFLEIADEADNVLLVGAYDLAYHDIALYSSSPGHREEIQARFLVVGDETLTTASSGDDSAYRDVSGTSFTAPMVAGAIAVIREANPALTPVEAANILLETAQRPVELGYGQTCSSDTDLGTFYSDCGAMTFGRGIMDLPAAITRAKELSGV